MKRFARIRVFSDTLAGRIFASLAIVTTLALLIFFLVASAVTYNVYEGTAERALREEVARAAQVLEALPAGERTEIATDQFAADRITLIDAEGNVVFDSQAPDAALSNHKTRPEIEQAQNGPDAVVLRHSETLNTDTLYAAAQLSDGSFVRLGQTRQSLASLVQGATLPLAAALALMMLIMLAFSQVLSRRIVEPIASLDVESPLSNRVYPELRPLLVRMDEQRALLRSQNEELESAANMRREFSANVSHEMKTPLQVISGYAELMKNGLVSASDQERFGGIIHSEAQSMRALIDDVLTLSRLDEPTLDRQMAPVNLYALTEVVKTRLIAIASPKGITVRVSTDSASLCEVLGSRMLLEQMVYNLLDNAIRYAPCDSRIDAVISSGEDSVGLAVIDRGPGIPAELREAVFERFYRIDKSRSKETGGTGLGLAIVKHVVELHDGSIEVSETPGGGATFTVSIPKDRIVPTSKAGTDR